MAIQIRLDWGPKFIYGALVLLSLLALETGYLLDNGLLLGTRTFHNHLLGHILSEIGVAGLVGFILALTFERVSANEFKKLAEKQREAANKDVFRNVWGYGMPRTITDTIEKQVLRTMFVRKNMKATFTLEVIDGPESMKYVLAQRELSYDVENLTDHPQDFPFVASTDTAPTLELNDQARFVSVSVECCEKPFSMGAEHILKLQKEKELEKFLELAPDKVRILPDTPTKIMVVSQTVKHLKGGYLYLILSYHTCDLELLVKVPNRDLDIIVNPYADNVLKTTRMHDPRMGVYHWKIERPVLAYQGIAVAWKQRA